MEKIKNFFYKLIKLSKIIYNNECLIIKNSELIEFRFSNVNEGEK